MLLQISKKIQFQIGGSFKNWEMIIGTCTIKAAFI